MIYGCNGCKNLQILEKLEKVRVIESWANLHGWMNDI